MSKLSEKLRNLKPQIKKKTPREEMPEEAIPKKKIKLPKLIKKREPKEKKQKKLREPREPREKKPRKKLQVDKKILIGGGIVSLLLIIVIVIASMGGSNKTESPIAEDVPNAPIETPIVSAPAPNIPEQTSFVDANVITYSFDGEIWLNNTTSGLVDSVNLSTIDLNKIDGFNARYGQVIPPYVPPVVEQPITVEPAVEIVLDENGNPIVLQIVEDSMDVSEQPVPTIEEVVIDETPIVDMKYGLEKPVETSYIIFKKDGNSLIFGDVARKTLLKVYESNGVIAIQKLMDNIDTSKVTAVDVSPIAVVVATEDRNITIASLIDEGYVKNFPISSLSAVVGSTNIKADSKITNVLWDDQNFYYTIDGNLFKVVGDADFSSVKNLAEIISTGFKHADLKDNISDMFLYGNNLYVINDFGFNSDNSILMKINKEDLKVEGMMELKGIYSKVIGTNGSKVYIRQSEFIKEIDLDMFKPGNAYTRTAGVPVVVHNDYAYTVIDGLLKVSNLTDRTNEIRSVGVIGDTLFIGK